MVIKIFLKGKSVNLGPQTSRGPNFFSPGALGAQIFFPGGPRAPTFNHFQYFGIGIGYGYWLLVNVIGIISIGCEYWLLVTGIE